MRGISNVMLLGRLTSDPELKQSKNGRSYTSFSLAINRNWKSKSGEVVSETDFHRVIAFGRLGETVVRFLHKGQPVIIFGRLSNRAYTDPEGKRRYITEVVMDDFNFIDRGTKPKSLLGNEEKSDPEPSEEEEEVQEEELVAA